MAYGIGYRTGLFFITYPYKVLHKNSLFDNFEFNNNNKIKMSFIIKYY